MTDKNIQIKLGYLAPGQSYFLKAPDFMLSGNSSLSLDIKDQNAPLEVEVTSI